MKELIVIQSLLHAPKTQYNKFGGYSYRSCEDILNAVKPLLTENGCYITLNDEVVYIGDRYYIRATATIWNSEGQCVSNSAMAREEEPGKGMTAAQNSGATSSYARKYALNGLLAIDDVKDDDATNTHDKKPQPKAKPVKQDDNAVAKYAEAINAADTRDALNQVWGEIKRTNPELAGKDSALYEAAKLKGQQLAKAS